MTAGDVSSSRLFSTLSAVIDRRYSSDPIPICDSVHTNRPYSAIFTANNKNFEKNSPNNSATTAR